MQWVCCKERSRNWIPQVNMPVQLGPEANTLSCLKLGYKNLPGHVKCAAKSHTFYILAHHAMFGVLTCNSIKGNYEVFGHIAIARAGQSAEKHACF